jgi:enamine deaminase RidA (YjgF/YER057c/UK114 family)
MSQRIDRRGLLTHGACLAAGAALTWLGLRQDGRGLEAGGFAGGTPPTPPAVADGDEETPEQRLRKLKIELPMLEKPKGATLVPAVLSGNMLYVSGHGPGSVDGKRIVGKLGKDYTVKEGREAARRVGLTILSVVRAELGSLDKVVRLVKTLGMVNCTPDFTQQPQVINGFSDLMVEVFGDKAGKGARSAVGMVALPGGIPVEIEAIFQVKG